MKKDMPLEGLRWSRDSGSALYDTPQNGRSRTGWGVNPLILIELYCLEFYFFYILLQKYNNISKHARKLGESFRKSCWQRENVYKCAKNIRKMKWYPIIRILLYLREIESKEL